MIASLTLCYSLPHSSVQPPPTAVTTRDQTEGLKATLRCIASLFFWERRVAIHCSLLSSTPFGLAPGFLLGLMAWLDFSIWDVKDFGKPQHFVAWMAIPLLQHDVTCDSWWEAVGPLWLALGFTYGENFQRGLSCINPWMEFENQTYQSYLQNGQPKKSQLLSSFQTHQWFQKLHRSLSYTTNFGVPNRL